MLQSLSRFRSALMGIAALWVALYHFSTTDGVDLLHYVSMVGYGGVDIFLFLSGFGLTMGYAKHSLGGFYWRRFIRLYPTYLVTLLITGKILGSRGVLNLLAESSGIGYFFRGVAPEADWYIAFMYLLYLIFPLWMWFCGNGSSLRRVVRCTVGASLLGIVWCLCLIFWCRNQMLMLSSTRVPIFFFGSLAAFCFRRRWSLSRASVITFVVLGVLAYLLLVLMIEHLNFKQLWHFGFLWYPFILIVPGLMIVLPWLLDRFPGFVNRVFSFVGTISLEFYLLHCVVLEYASRHFLLYFQQHPYLTFFAFILVSLLLSWLFHWFMKHLTSLFRYVVLFIRC